jgi:oligopeptide transport system substrate-binding protein
LLLPACIEVSERESESAYSIALPASGRSLDPAFAVDPMLSELFDLIYVRLVRVDHESEVPRPLLAESWHVSQDRLRWRFRLRDDFEFDDGAPITAHDVVRSLRRLVDPRLGSSFGSLLYPIDGAREMHTGLLNPESEIGIRAPSTHTVELTLREPASYLPALLSAVGYIVRTDGMRIAPVGSGSYQVVRRDSQRIELVRSENPVATHDLPVDADTVTIELVGSDVPALSLVEVGAVDAAILPCLPGDERSGSLRSVERMPVPVVHHLELNAGLPPTDDRRVRQALVEALDRSALARSIGAGRSIWDGTISPAGSVATPKRTVDGENHAPARHMLLRAAAGERLSVSVAYSRTEVNELIVEAAANTWRELLGIHVDTVQLARGEFLERIEAGDFNVFKLGHRASYADAHATLQPLFGSAFTRGRLGVESSELDALLAEGARAVELPARRTTYAKLESLLTDDLAVVFPLYSELRALYVRP